MEVRTREKLPLVEPNMSQHGLMHDQILTSAIVDLYRRIKEKRTNGCTISFKVDNREVELDVRVISDEILNNVDNDIVHLDDIKKEGE